MPTGHGSGQTFTNTQRVSPYQKFKWTVEIDGFTKAGFQTCTGLSAAINVVTYREGGDNNTVHKQPGFTEYAPITLTRGMSEDLDMHNWANEVANLSGNVGVDPSIRRNMSIVLRDRNGMEVRRWNVVECWVSEYKFDDLDAEDDGVLIESITIEHEGWELV